MITEIIALSMAISLGFVQYLSDRFSNYFQKYYTKILSFSAGISVTYIFLDMFPYFTRRVTGLSEFLFFSLFIGFVLIHLIEKHIFHHTNKWIIEKELMYQNQIILIVYHIILGFVLYDFAIQGLQQVLLLFFPIIIFTAMSTLPLKEHSSNIVNIFVSSSTLVGVIFAIIISPIITNTILTILLGFVVGVLMFTIFRHSLPMGKEGKPLYFLIGITIYSPIIVLSWLL